MLIIIIEKHGISTSQVSDMYYTLRNHKTVEIINLGKEKTNKFFSRW